MTRREVERAVRNPQSLWPSAWYYETSRGIEIYSNGVSGRLCVLSWRKIEAAIRHRNILQEKP